MARTLITARGKAFKLEGMVEIKQRIGRIVTKANSADIKRVYMRGAMVLRNEARDLAPIKTGRLKAAIFAAYGPPYKQTVLVGVNYRIAPHAHIVEFGSSHSPPHPYLRPAMNYTRSMVVRVIAEGFLSMLEDAAR